MLAYLCFIPTSGKPVVLSHTKGFSDPYIPTAKLPNFPKPLTELFDFDPAELAYSELLQKCDRVFNNLVISAHQADLEGKHTRKQSQFLGLVSTKNWTCYNLLIAECTNISQLSASLIKFICYPDKQRFTSTACLYECKHEDAARNEHFY